MKPVPDFEAAPVLETARLRLRPHRLEDLAALTAMWADPAVTRFIGGRPATREECWSRLLRYVGHWKLRGFGYWAVESRQDGQYSGDVGFADWKRDIDPPLDLMPESGWAFASGRHGQGLATEAVVAVLAWGDRHFPAQSTACLISPENAASLRLAGRCGYREYARTTFKGSPVILLRR